MKLLKLQLISIIHPDFQTWFHGHDLACHDSTLITWRMASQYVNGCKNNGRREFCRGIRNSERNTGWQGKLITKRRNCNEARIPTNAFCLKRKALLRGKRQGRRNLCFECTIENLATYRQFTKAAWDWIIKKKKNKKQKKEKKRNQNCIKPELSQFLFLQQKM